MGDNRTYEHVQLSQRISLSSGLIARTARFPPLEVSSILFAAANAADVAAAVAVVADDVADVVV